MQTYTHDQTGRSPRSSTQSDFCRPAEDAILRKHRGGGSQGIQAARTLKTSISVRRPSSGQFRFGELASVRIKNQLIKYARGERKMSFARHNIGANRATGFLGSGGHRRREMGGFGRVGRNLRDPDKE